MHKDLDEKPKAIGRTWSEFCDILKEHDDKQNGFNEPTAMQLHYDRGHEGLGVVVQTGYGDGYYPVEATYEDGLIKEIKVKFF